MRGSKPVPGFRARLVSRAAESNKGVSHDGFMAFCRAGCSSGTSAAAAALALGRGQTAGVGVGVGTGFPSFPYCCLPLFLLFYQPSNHRNDRSGREIEWTRQNARAVAAAPRATRTVLLEGGGTMARGCGQRDTFDASRLHDTISPSTSISRCLLALLPTSAPLRRVG